MPITSEIDVCVHRVPCIQPPPEYVITPFLGARLEPAWKPRTRPNHDRRRMVRQYPPGSSRLMLGKIHVLYPYRPPFILATINRAYSMPVASHRVNRHVRYDGRCLSHVVARRAAVAFETHTHIYIYIYGGGTVRVEAHFRMVRSAWRRERETTIIFPRRHSPF